MRVLAGAGECASSAGTTWVEQLRVADLSVGTYCIPAGGTDDQSPHTEDEIYIVTAGRATLTTGEEQAEVLAGSVVYVPAGEVHRFTDIAEDLAVVVVFAPAEYSRAAEV